MKFGKIAPELVADLFGDITIPDGSREILFFLDEQRQRLSAALRYSRISDQGYLLIAKYLVGWLRGYQKLCGIGLLGLGLSGGIDSALVALLSLLSAGDDGVFTQNIPVKSLKKDAKHAVRFANALGIPCPVRDATACYESWAAELEIATTEPASFLALNLKSEVRQFLLHWRLRVEAQRRQTIGILIGTGNWSEDGFLFYFTKFGDGRRDIDLITALSKTHLRGMFRALCLYLRIPETAWRSIYDKAPSAGLVLTNGHYQSDDDELSGTYPERDRVQAVIAKHGGDLNKICAALNLEERRLLARMLPWYWKGWHKGQTPAPERPLSLLFVPEEIAALREEVAE